jgi:hypothetical protein
LSQAIPVRAALGGNREAAETAETAQTYSSATSGSFSTGFTQAGFSATRSPKPTETAETYPAAAGGPVSAVVAVPAGGLREKPAGGGAGPTADGFPLRQGRPGGPGGPPEADRGAPAWVQLLLTKQLLQNHKPLILLTKLTSNARLPGLGKIMGSWRTHHLRRYLVPASSPDAGYFAVHPLLVAGRSAGWLVFAATDDATYHLYPSATWARHAIYCPMISTCYASKSDMQ